MVNGCLDALLLQHLGYRLRLAPAHAIDDAALFRMPADEVKDGFAFLLLLIAPLYGKAEVGTVKRRNENLRLLKMKLFNNIFAGNFVGRSGQRNDGDCLLYTSPSPRD